MKEIAPRIAAAGAAVAAHLVATTTLGSATVARLVYAAAAAAVLALAARDIHRHDPPRARLWWMVWAGPAIGHSGTVGELVAIAAGQPDLGALVVAVLGLVGLGMMVVAGRAVLRAATGGPDLEGALDGIIIAVILAAAMWQFVVAPSPALSESLGGTSTSQVDDVLVALAYAVMPAALLSFTLRLVFLRPRTPSAWFLLGGNVALLSGSATLLMLSSQRAVDIVVPALWLSGYTCVAGATGHPSMRDLTQPVERASGAMSLARLALLCLAIVGGQAIVLLQAGSSIGLVTVVAAMATTVLVAVRLGGLMVAAERARRAADAARDEAVHRSHHDALTGLPNRALLTRWLDDHDDVQLGVLFCDLDGFKAVNDTHGHDVGDALLVAVADRLRGSVREGDRVARMAGDEFIVVTGAGDDPRALDGLAERLAGRLVEPYEIDGLRVEVGASIGVATAAPGTDPEDALRAADHAMYEAKRAGRTGAAPRGAVA